MAVGIFSKIKQLVQEVRKGLQWANDNVYKSFIKPFAKPILGALGPVGQTIGKDLEVASSFLDYGYGADKNVVQLAQLFIEVSDPMHSMHSVQQKDIRYPNQIIMPKS
ncbi:MAG: hypothetical protein EZS28_018591 [Streblomastix strix]|uniref:Uncharacterized protein n=1 Tax=Streblomastix strix TaxID=222440 RepID=A0A5J4VTD3_9EUKA|nr:MAG: hypothetical protein EZS28_018591 [Streblomastix strix]